MPKQSKHEAAIRQRLYEVEADISSRRQGLTELENEQRILEELLKRAEDDPDFREVKS